METLKRTGITAGWSIAYYLFGVAVLFLCAQAYRLAFPFGWESAWLASSVFWAVLTAYGLCFVVLVATPGYMLASRFIRSNRWCALLAGAAALAASVACYVLLMSMSYEGGC
jgi:hypothetical protein